MNEGSKSEGDGADEENSGEDIAGTELIAKGASEVSN